MDSKKVVFYVFDEEENFKKTYNFIAGELLVKGFKSIKDLPTFQAALDSTDELDYICLVVHVFYTEGIKGIKRYIASGIKKRYPLINELYVSEGSAERIKHEMVASEIPIVNIYKYHQILTQVQDDNIRLYTKKEIMTPIEKPRKPKKSTQERKPVKLAKEGLPKAYYGIITALYKDEFEEVKEVLKFLDKNIIKTKKKEYYFGKTSDKRKRIIVGSVLNATGMVDASVISTQMLELFKPKYLLMPGVCAGRSDLNFGDIVVANQIFTLQKGKLSDIGRKDQHGKVTPLKLYDQNQNQVDFNHLFDIDGNQISLTVEKFEIEHDAMIQIDTLTIDKLTRKIPEIESAINQSIKHMNSPIKIHLAPFACSTMVIDKLDFFKSVVQNINRKAAAVEMESYGIARACQFANNGKTIPIIFKSVMDNGYQKTDSHKRFAAHTSSLFLKQLFETGII